LSIAPAILLVTAAVLPVVFTPFVAKLVGLTGFNSLLHDCTFVSASVTRRAGCLLPCGHL
jgi:hypothetical protein